MSTMTDLKPQPIEKVSIVISKGSLDGIYPGLIMANGARAEGIEANLFFTFFGLDAIHVKRHDHIKISTVGNPGLHVPTLVGGLPGMSAVVTHLMDRKMHDLDIPSIPEFVDMIADTGAGLYACKASVDLFGMTQADFVPAVKDIITVGEFYEIAAGGQIIFT
jgi:peroxiredoxin family protein